MKYLPLPRLRDNIIRASQRLRIDRLSCASRLILLFAIVPLLNACGGGGGGTSSNSSETVSVSMSPAAQLGEQIFKDVSLSASGKMSCATCHDPAHEIGRAHV